MGVKLKLKFFLITNRRLLNLAIPIIFYFFHLSFSEFDLEWMITSCSEKEDPCMKAAMESLKDLKSQEEAQGWFKKKVQNAVLGGNQSNTGTGVHTEDGTTHVAHTIELKNSAGELLRRVTDCAAAPKKK
jgi:hypothetical protein